MKTAAALIVIVLSLGFALFFLESANLEWRSYFKPRYQNVERETFENSKSYVHGMTQDLAKKYEEFLKGSKEEQGIIKNVIQSTFASFDAEKIESSSLRLFLIDQRGY